MAQAKMEEYYSKALNALDSVNVPEERKAALRKYASDMMKRQK
jgi:geranylgeranyl pyrophosphate synthase